MEEGTSICADATIVCGGTIWKYAMIATGIVITKDVPDNTIGSGMSAKYKRIMTEQVEKI
ncbi:hypothetical protein [Butyrivibrio sp. NC3005]|uniref:hypothetical protein n=1 Tax=Butyrivibrio sp. NC3005 TaxID=1280685 RepID=UPI0004221507|nr:hypothetical protein [Butyrivibrio sp. NC3005]